MFGEDIALIPVTRDVFVARNVPSHYTAGNLQTHVAEIMNRAGYRNAHVDVRPGRKTGRFYVQVRS